MSAANQVRLIISTPTFYFITLRFRTSTFFIEKLFVQLLPSVVFIHFFYPHSFRSFVIKMLAVYNPLTTVVLSGAALLLGLPVAVIAIIFEKVTMPDIVLGSKEIDIGPGGTKTVTWNLLSGPNDAVFAAAYISMISAILLVGGLAVVRHVARHNIWGWLVFLPGLANVLGQIGCCAYVFIVSSQHPEAVSRNELKYVNGNYDTNGKSYTRESWACSMKSLYLDQEPWSDKACSSFVCTVLRKIVYPLIGI
jgi:hypothetical protein